MAHTRKMLKPKIVLDPLLGIIDISPILPLVDTREFQSLGFKYQLGLASTIYPAATHTRKQHSLGAYERTRRLTEDWVMRNLLSKPQAFALQVFALCHDIGHGPFSHVTESLGRETHNERGRRIVRTLRPVIESIGCNFEEFYDIYSEKNPLYAVVRDKNLGTEKFDYLERDSFYTIGERPGVEYIAKYISFVDGELGIDETAIDQAKAIQEFYIKMSKHVYLRKKSSIAQRLFEKMTHVLMRDGNLTEKKLFGLTDFGLLGLFEVSDHPLVRKYYGNFVQGIFPKLVCEIKDEAFVSSTGIAAKHIRTFGIPKELFMRLIHTKAMRDLDVLSVAERDIARLLGISEESLIIIPPFSEERFEPQDITVFTNDGKKRMLSEFYPNHFEAMREYGHSHLSIRVAVYPEYRERIYRTGEAVKEYLMNLAVDH